MLVSVFLVDVAISKHFDYRGWSSCFEEEKRRKRGLLWVHHENRQLIPSRVSVNQVEQKKISFIVENQITYWCFMISKLTHRFFRRIIWSLSIHRLSHASFSLMLLSGVISANLPQLCLSLTRIAIMTSQYQLKTSLKTLICFVVN